jgi:hypothetical protein
MIRGSLWSATKPFFNIKKVRARLTELVHQTLTKEGVKVEKDNFSLESYHKYVSEENHQAIIKKTRRLEPKYFDFDIDSFSNAIRTYFNCNLSWTTSGEYNPGVITRIKMPRSNNFNPAHKDIYQVYDQTKKSLTWLIFGYPFAVSIMDLDYPLSPDPI